MILKCIATGSDGNCYILTSDSGKHLILDAGIPIGEIKKGLDFDIENVEACIITHEHRDHSLSAGKLRRMGIKVWEPYQFADIKKIKTKLNEFTISSFDVPHNGCTNRAFLITEGESTLLYATDFEYIGYDLSSKQINAMLIEMNYQKSRIEGNNHMVHVVLGHAEEQTTIEVINHNMKYLRNVILCHMSKSGALDRVTAMEHIREVVPKYIDVQWAKPGNEINLNFIPF